MLGRFSNNPYYQEYEQQLICLHALIAEGKEDEADQVRQDMERPERELDAEEMKRLNGLSADLYSLNDDEIYEQTKLTSEQLRQALINARKSSDDIEMLSLFRKGTGLFKAADVAFLRAQAYERLKHPRPALLFVQKAAALNPEDTIYRTFEIERLYQSHRIEEAIEKAQALIASPGISLSMTLSMAAILCQCARELSPEKKRTLFGQVRQTLEKALNQPTTNNQVDREYAFGYITLAFCYEHLNRPARALDAYNQALRFPYDNDTAFAYRGNLRLKNDYSGAMADFVESVRLKTDIPFPYLFLAKDALVHENYIRCIELCDHLMHITDNASILAAALEFSAIAKIGEGYATDIVKEEFEKARSLDPLNDRIRDNFQKWQESLVAHSLKAIDISTLFNPAQWKMPAIQNQGYERIFRRAA